jgi:hypothetical protein
MNLQKKRPELGARDSIASMRVSKRVVLSGSHGSFEAGARLVVAVDRPNEPLSAKLGAGLFSSVVSCGIDLESIMVLIEFNGMPIKKNLRGPAV